MRLAQEAKEFSPVARIRISVENDHGESLLAVGELVFELGRDDVSCLTLDSIEAAVDAFKNEALSKVEHALLAHSQRLFIQRAIERRKRKGRGRSDEADAPGCVKGGGQLSARPWIARSVAETLRLNP